MKGSDSVGNGGRCTKADRGSQRWLLIKENDRGFESKQGRIGIDEWMPKGLKEASAACRWKRRRIHESAPDHTSNRRTRRIRESAPDHNEKEEDRESAPA